MAEEPCLIVHWESRLHKGAFVPAETMGLTRYLQEAFQTQPALQSIRQVYLLMASAGADVSEPFESLASLNTLLETLVGLSQERNLNIDGVLMGAMGTYGGASLLLTTVCSTLWCDNPEQLHLVGKPNI